MPHLLFLLLLVAPPQPTGVSAARGSTEEEIRTEWANSIRWMEPGVTMVDLSQGDSLDLNCRGLRHMAKIRAPLELEWRLFDRPLMDEGSTGRIHLLEDDGRLTVENVNARDSGLYATYTSAESLASVLDLRLSVNASAGTSAKVEAANGRMMAVCLFVVRVDSLRNYTLREGEPFTVNMSPWLAPIASTLNALDMPQDEWSLTWFRDGEEETSCQKISTCLFNFTASRERTFGIWRLEMRSLADRRAQRRILMEFVLSVRPPLVYLETFPLATHKFYMVYGSLLIGLFLLSLHLFNNLNWTPFAFDILPDQVSPKAVLDQAGVFLKETRV